MPTLSFSNLNDQKLYRLCKFYGKQAKKWRYKFMDLLPEVHKRKLYEKKGFSSIFEFGKKLAGLNEKQVRTILNLEKRFDDKPLLKNLLINGEVSANKLVRIQSIATKENEKFWVNQVKILPNRALETLVRDEKLSQNDTTSSKRLPDENSLQKRFFNNKSLHVQTSTPQKSTNDNNTPEENIATFLAELKFTIKPLKKLLELQQKGFDINQLILEMLQKRELEIAQEKEQISRQLTQADSRYIPIQVKKIIQKEHGAKCSINSCQKPAEQIHHTQRFSIAHTHDPHYLAPLCKNHHTIAHSIDLKFQQKRAFSG